MYEKQTNQLFLSSFQPIDTYENIDTEDYKKKGNETRQHAGRKFGNTSALKNHTKLTKQTIFRLYQID